jgi:hypothetical protein
MISGVACEVGGVTDGNTGAGGAGGALLSIGAAAGLAFAGDICPHESQLPTGSQHD